MKILVLTKRQYMGKDLLDDRFGRFRELPLELVRLGHRVRGITISYRKRAEGILVDCDLSGHNCVAWHSTNFTHGLVPRLDRAVRVASKVAAEFKPDVIWSCSDAYHAIFGVWLAKRFKTRSVIDLYDNFEAFGATRLPLVRPLFRKAVQKADGVTCFSRRMANHVVQNHSRHKPTAVVESAVQKTLFHPQDKKQCRQKLKLPEEPQIIGTAGALHSSRGIDTLFQAFELLAAKNERLHLALAGPRQRGMQIPTGPRVHDLGVLPHEEVPCLINALDLAVICYRQSAQGELSFPQKAYEIIACRVPLIAAAVGCMNELFSRYPQYLYEPENPHSLAEAVLLQLKNKVTIATEVPSWADSAKQLESFFEKVVQGVPTTTRTQPVADIPR